ncbi:MAG: hypothetical protein OXT09_08410 [Myxococcales bacterium]|nr:hypothetical protein [Myxococcales bacterium]
MQHTYRAERFDQAMLMVKEQLGPDAVIVGTRQVGTAGGRLYEITALAGADAESQGMGPRDLERSRELERRLRGLGLESTIARRWASALSPQLEQGVWTAGTRRALARLIEGEIAFGGPVGRGARVVALVGPTGVGKTTTVAKLAARAALIENRRIALVSIDQYRIGGSDQLERYAELIGVPMSIAEDARSLEIALRRFDDAELVFVDTAGRSPRDLHALAEMASTLRGVHEPVEVHLCLPASMRDAEMELAIERHSVLDPQRLNVTKVDEAVGKGTVIGAYSISGLPLSYITTGQRVPEDIELASAQTLAALLHTDGSAQPC